jgi:hypothetical protein
MFLVSRLEAVIQDGRRFPMTQNVAIHQPTALDLCDQIRVAIPEEIRAANRITAEGSQYIEKAEEEAERIVAKAQEQAAFLIDERGLTQAAEEEGGRIVNRAEKDAEEVRRGADEYAASVLISLEGEVARTLQSIKKGIALLDERRAPDDERNGVGDQDAWEPATQESEEDVSQPVRA